MHSLAPTWAKPWSVWRPPSVAALLRRFVTPRKRRQRPASTPLRHPQESCERASTVARTMQSKFCVVGDMSLSETPPWTTTYA
jgi:hypothetical protein